MTRMPKVVEVARSLVNKAPHQGVNPDEVVAIGAGIQGGVLKGEVKDGAPARRHAVVARHPKPSAACSRKLIERNTTIPARKSEIFSTASDSQPGGQIHMLQGERQFSKDNKTIGKFQSHATSRPPRAADASDRSDR